MRGIHTHCWSASQSATVHPRGCGEYQYMHGFDSDVSGSSPRMRGIRGMATLVLLDVSGSSPRMRGIRLGVVVRIAHYRFIPADAGNTCSPRSAHPAPAVHPRGCGEYDPPDSGVSSTIGSSPRMRGIRLRIRLRLGTARFIPADAGNTLLGLLLGAVLLVHPRGCGEYFREPSPMPHHCGSSPRMRGIPLI